MKRNLFFILLAMTLLSVQLSLATTDTQEAAEDPAPFYFAVMEDAPSSDVVVSINVIEKLKILGAINEEVQPQTTRFFKDVDAYDSADDIIIAIYNGEARVVLSKELKEKHYSFKANLMHALEYKNVPYKIVYTEELTSSDLKDLFAESVKQESEQKTYEEKKEYEKKMEMLKSEEAAKKQAKETARAAGCQGCELGTSCIPYGTRVEQEGIAKYCDITGELIVQKGMGLACQNHYECFSNQCVDAVCDSLAQELRETRGILEKIFDWLKSFFGGE